MDTTYRKNLKAVLTASKDYTDNSIEKLKWELGTYDLSVTTDSTVAYTKTIPTNAIKGRLNYIGGASKVSENLIVLNDVAETTTNGITYKVDNGVITLNGTATGWVSITLFSGSLSGTYTFKDFGSGTSTASNNIRIAESGSYTKFIPISNVSTATDITAIQFYCEANTTLTNVVIKPMLVKGTTAPTEFSEGFEGIRNAKTTSVVVSGTDVAPITKAIPSEIQALEGYGWGVNDTCYNYIDFETKKFIQKVGRVDLGSLTWEYNSNGVYISATRIKSISNLKNAISSTYEYNGTANAGSASSMASNLSDKQMCSYSNADNAGKLVVKDSSLGTTGTPSGYLYYELADASKTETDISQYIDDDFKTIDITNMTTATFENEFGYDVPSEIDYLIEEVKA